MFSREQTIYAGSDIVEVKTRDVEWDELRKLRNQELANTDWWAVKDLTMSQAKKDYRIFLRDLPQNYQSANEACDAWAAYVKPE